jgi:hypothetical protein
MMPTGIKLRPELLLEEIYKKFQFKTRVVVAIYNKGDYDEELQTIKEVARRSAHMHSLRIGLVSDPKLVKKLKKETSWFGDASLNTMILKRYDGELFNLDLLQVSLQENAYHWIWKKSIKEVEQLSAEVFDQVNMIGQGVVLGFVDMASKDDTVRRESANLVNAVLPSVAKAVYRALVTVYVDVGDWPTDIRRQFGVRHGTLPALSISNHDRGVIAYPADEPLLTDELVAFATKVVKGEIEAERV